MVVTDRIKERARHIQRYYHADEFLPYKDMITPEDLARAELLQPKFRLDDCPNDAQEFPPSWKDTSDLSGKNSLSGVLHSPAWTSLPTRRQSVSRQTTKIKAADLSKSDGDDDDGFAQSVISDLFDQPSAQTPWADQQAESVP